jgi:hypothetical protein
MIEQWLSRVAHLCAISGDPDNEFFYLGGPMTGLPQFNFPEFDRVAGILRTAGYNIVSPAELDDPVDHSRAMSSVDGAPGSGSHDGKLWESFLARDCVIVSMPTCVGGIFLPGWERSNGARLETFILDRLKKGLWLYEDEGLIQIDRDSYLNAVLAVAD